MARRQHQNRIQVLGLFLGVGVLLFLAYLMFGHPKMKAECKIEPSGDGTCTFTNQGRISTTVCGFLEAKCDVPGVGTAQYMVCSGQVGAGEVKYVTIHFPTFGELISRALKESPMSEVNDLCKFAWTPKQD